MKFSRITWTLVLVIVAVCALVWVGNLLSLRQGYHAVFLSNGQVYFGTVTWEDRHELTLTHVYYIQTGASASSTALDVSLAKLGNEVHGPEDQLVINRDHIVFLERLKSDSKILKAIASYSKSSSTQ